MVRLRFYAELKAFLPPARRDGEVTIAPVRPHETLKHVIETCGVPHTEVAVVLKDGQARPLSHRPLADGDRYAVFPVWRRLGPTRPDADRLRFAADAHLARLARWLRFAGWDTAWHAEGGDADLAALARREHRIVLTRDRALLMHRDIAEGAWLPDLHPEAQMRDLVTRFGLEVSAGSRPPRCMLCNRTLRAAAPDEVIALAPPGARGFGAHWRCDDCGRLYWPGSHWRRMRSTLDALAAALPGG